VQYDQEHILSLAAAADIMVSSNIDLPLLHGLPFTIKDAFHADGFFCSKGSPGLYGEMSKFDATFLARLKAAGALMLGITNTPELLLSYETDNLIYGRSNNPYDLSRTPGGSSGGEAAIIASGGSPVGIANDAGGSIRQPAHYCGICGHKPTHGMVPLTGLFPGNGAGIGTRLLSIGPMARHVEDLILLMSVISGTDHIDSYCSPVSFGNVNEIKLKNLRVAWFFENPAGGFPCEDTVKSIEQILRLLKNDVYSLNHHFPDDLKNVYRLHLETFMFGGNGGETVKQLFAKLNQTHISPLAQQFLKLADKCRFSVSDLRERFIELEHFRYNMMRFMQDYDVIISPVTATPARHHGETFANLNDVSYVIAHNLTGWPATVVPCGYSRDGLPIGVQIAARPWHDHVGLAVALKIQQYAGVFAIPEID